MRNKEFMKLVYLHNELIKERIGYYIGIDFIINRLIKYIIL